MSQKSPFKVHLLPKQRYSWCRCGLSSNGALCDGSHHGTGKQPLEFEVQKEDDYFLCGCKQTSNPPFCDGTHKKI